MTLTTRRTRLAGGAAGLFAFTLFFNLRYLAATDALPEEDHFLLATHLYETGVLSIGGPPSLFRPPGFPVFVAGVLHLRDALAPGLDGGHAVTFAHGLLLSVAAVAVFLHSARALRLDLALAAGVIYAFHPLNLLFARNLTYYPLHMVLLTLATIALARAVASRRHRLPAAAAAGLLFGVATVVRPVSMLLPPFVLLLARWVGGRGSWRPSFRFAGAFTLAMALAVAPCTWRNYRVSGRPVLVNAQDGYALWGLTASNDPWGDIAEWGRLWMGPGNALFERVTGVKYSIGALYEHNLALNDAFRAEAMANIRRNPARVAANVLGNLAAFNVDSSHRWLDRYDYGRPGWEWLPRAELARVFTVLVVLFGAFGLVRGVLRGDDGARAITAVYATFCVAHSLVVLMSRYTYVRMPLMLLALPLVLRDAEVNPRARRAVLVAVVYLTLAVWEAAFQ